MKLQIRALVRALGILVLGTLPAFAFETSAREALVIDYTTGAVLLEKNADQPVPPASMSKLMTLNMVFEALADERIALDDVFTVSETAWRMGGSTMFLEPRHRPSVEDLIRGIVIHSGNDACIVVAENLAGSEAVFAEQMTLRGREIGLTQSTFANATGWPDPNHRMSVRDLVWLGTRMIREFPQYYDYFAETEYTWDGITQPNRNPLLATSIGGDGLKTGHTEEAGYGLVGSAQKGDRRIVFAINGLPSSAARAVEAERILRWAFRDFENAVVFKEGDVVTTADVWIGSVASVELMVAHDVLTTMPIAARDQMVAKAVYEGPLTAPLAAGTIVGTLDVDIPGMAPLSIPLAAKEDVAEAGFLARVSAAAGLLAKDAMAYAFGGDE